MDEVKRIEQIGRDLHKLRQMLRDRTAWSLADDRLDQVILRWSSLKVDLVAAIETSWKLRTFLRRLADCPDTATPADIRRQVAEVLRGVSCPNDQDGGATDDRAG